MSWIVGSTPPGMDPSSLVRLKYPKSPADSVPVVCDFSGALAAIDCDYLDVTFTPSTSVIRNDDGPADLYVTGTPAINHTETRVSVWCAGGSVGFEYLISVLVRSVDGQMIERSFVFPVMLR